MAHLFALFDSDADLAQAQELLEAAGLGETVVEVVDSASRNNLEPAVPLVPGAALHPTAAGQPHGQAVAPFALDGLRRRGLDEDEARFLGNAVSGGAGLIIMESDEPDQLRAVLEKSSMQRLFTKD